MSSPLSGLLLAATTWFANAVLSLIASGSAFFARKFVFPLGALAGLSLSAFGLSQGMVLAASGEAPGIYLLSADSGAQPGMKIK